MWVSFHDLQWAIGGVKISFLQDMQDPFLLCCFASDPAILK